MVRRFMGVTALVCAMIALAAHPAAASNDKYWSQQWNMRAVHAEPAWKTGTGAGVTIAIIDSGVDLKHEDLAGAIVAGHDFVDNDSNPQDEFGHGTHVAGIAAARANNGLGVAGVAPSARIMPIRVLDPNGVETGDAVHNGVHWAVDHGADVINLSLGADVLTEDLSGGTLTSDVNYAWSKGVVPVISAGNDAFFRTGNPNAIIVSATGPNGQLASYANSVGFTKWGMVAPGGETGQGNANMVLSTIWSKSGAHYGYSAGTSMAAPHVAGAAAILRGLGLSPQETVDRLLNTAHDLGPQGRDLTYGYGALDVEAAVKGLRPVFTPTPPRETSPSATATSRPVSDFAGPGPHRRSTISSTSSPEPTSGDVATLPTPGPLAAAKDVGKKGSSSKLGLFSALAVGAAVVAGSGGYLFFRRRRRA